MKLHYFYLAALIALGASACGGGGSTGSVDTATTTTPTTPSTPTTGTATSTAGVQCPLSYSAYNASAKVQATSSYDWACATSRTLTANGIPDHDVTDGSFATPISAQNISVTFKLAPAVVSATGTNLNKTASGYVINGVKLDPGTAGTCASTATSTANGGGCVAANGTDPWTLEALGGAFKFGTDSSNGHVQPNGQYHYHGLPVGYIARVSASAQAMTLVGFAIDGFPIYAQYGYANPLDPNSALQGMKSSYQKKTLPSAGRPNTTTFPLGTFTQDFEFVAGSGDLDECNGRTGVTPEFPKGIYHYYITDAFPYIQRCVKGGV
jgi:hypothetical protein